MIAEAVDIEFAAPETAEPAESPDHRRARDRQPRPGAGGEPGQGGGKPKLIEAGD